LDYYIVTPALFFGGSEGLGDKKDTETLATLGGRETLELFFVGAVALVVKRLCAGKGHATIFIANLLRWHFVLHSLPADT